MKKKPEEQRQFVAVRGISFEGLIPCVRVEPGEFIPERVIEAISMDELLTAGDIKEAE